MGDTAYRAWMDAEAQIAMHLSALLGFKYGEKLFVGGAFDLVGKYDMAAFQIMGGGEQPQGWQSGCSQWHVTGEFNGVFTERDDALLTATTLMDRDNVPFSGLEGEHNFSEDMPNVVKVYLRTCPIIDKEIRDVVNGRKGIFSVIKDMEFGVVFKTVEDT
jgi:hypothetical protein